MTVVSDHSNMYIMGTNYRQVEGLKPREALSIKKLFSSPK